MTGDGISSASATRTIKFLTKAGTYMAELMSPWGDLWQQFEGTVANPGGITPDFAVEKPILYFACASSRVAEGITTPDAIDFYFNGTKIDFMGDTSTGTFAGLFKKVSPAGDNPYYGLQIVQNIVVAAGFAPAVIKAVAQVSYGTQRDSLQASYTIDVQQSTGTGARVTIAAGDTKNFVISEKGGSCILKARAWQGGAELTTNLTYEWYKMTQNGWSLMSQTSQAITINEADVATSGEYMVKVYQSGQYLGQDIQRVMDVSDPYDIDPCPSPEDEAISEDLNGNGEVTYTPKVVKRGTNTQALNTLFFFIVKSATGNILNADYNVAKSTFTVTRAMCVQAGGDVSLTIISQD